MGDGSYETFVSSAALYEHLPGEGYRVTPVLLVPETLYEHMGGCSPCEAYRLIVKCKAGAARVDAVRVEVEPCENRVIEEREVVEATRKLLEHLESLYALL